MKDFEQLLVRIFYVISEFATEPSGVQVANTSLREYEPEERVTLAERTLVSSVSLYAALGGDITP